MEIQMTNRMSLLSRFFQYYSTVQFQCYSIVMSITHDFRYYSGVQVLQYSVIHFFRSTLLAQSTIVLSVLLVE